MRLRARQFREKSPIPIKVKRFFLGAVIMIKYFYKDNKSEKVRLFNEFRSGCWIHVESPTPSEITFLREKINNKDIIQFVTYESVLNDFLTALEPTNVILKNLFSGKFLKLTDQEKEWVEDLYFSNSQLIELSQANLRNIVNIREAYSTIITNNLNRVIRLLTSLTVILAVPTMIASIYGMNIDLPFDHSPNAFFII